MVVGAGDRCAHNCQRSCLGQTGNIFMQGMNGVGCGGNPNKAKENTSSKDDAATSLVRVMIFSFRPTDLYDRISAKTAPDNPKNPKAVRTPRTPKILKFECGRVRTVLAAFGFLECGEFSPLLDF